MDSTNPGPTFEYPASLQECMVSEPDYLRQHPEYSRLCTGIVIYDKAGKMLLVQRAKTEKAFPNLWASHQEIPGGKVDTTDKTLIHGAVRELREETGLEATRIVGKVGTLSFEDRKADGSVTRWLKHIFEMEVRDLEAIVLDPAEHQAHLFASEDEVVGERVGNVRLEYVSPANKAIKVDAFRQRGGAAGMRVAEGGTEGRSAAALDGNS